MAIILITGLLLTIPIEGSAKWWDKFGEPQYGGTFILATNRLGDSWDPAFTPTVNFFPYEQLFMGDRTLAPDIWSYKVVGAPPNHVGLLAEAGYPDGFKTNVYMPNEQDLELAQIIKSYFMDIGVDMTINTLDQNQYIQFSSSGKVDQLGFVQLSNMTYPVNISFFMRTSMAPQNGADPSTEEVGPYEDLYKQFIGASDVAEAKQIGYQLQEHALRMHWGLMTTGRVYFDAARPHLKGFNGEDMTGWNRVWVWTGLWLDRN